MPRTAAPIALGLVASLTLWLSPAPTQANAVVAPGAAPGSIAREGASEVGLRKLLNGVTSTGVPGVLVRVQDGREVRAAAAGVSDLTTGAPLRSHARFRAGSITKTFVATVILQLVGEGRLRLDEPVEPRLPGLLANGKNITVRQLLNHTSGLFDYTHDPAEQAGEVRNQVFTPRELVAIAETHPSRFSPGTSWGYSNTNYIVAGLLVEAVTRHRLGQELQTRILGPLGLSNTSFPVTSSRIPGYYAHGYVSTDVLPTPDGRPYDVLGQNPSAYWASGAVISNAADLALFYQALMSGRLLSPKLLREMKTTVAADPADPDHLRYGLGIERVQDVCGANWGHGGRVFGYESGAYWNEQTGRTVVIASTMSPAPEAAATALSSLTDFALCGFPALQAR